MAGAANPLMTQQTPPATVSTPPVASPAYSPATPAAAQNLAATGGPNIYNQSANAYQGALTGTQNAMGGPNIGAFMNPYTSMVTGQTLGDLERQRQMAINTTGAQASAAGAFGGSRHGVADALTNEAFARQGAQTFGNLQQQGFNTALGAAQGQQALGLQGAGQLGQLAQTGFGFGQQIGQQQAQQGAMQQGVMQMLIDAARGQYAGYTGAPQQALNLPMAAVGGANMGQGTTTGTTSQQPGLFNYLSLGLGLI